MDGCLKASFESIEIGFHDFNKITEWHRDHLEMVLYVNLYSLDFGIKAN